MPPVITSRTNETVKQTRALTQARARREQGLHLVEGEKLVQEAIASGCAVARLFVEEGFIAPEADAEQTVTVSRGVMEALCESRTPQHVCAAVRTPSSAAPAAFPAGLIVILDCIQDAGNLGTIVRTADAFGAAGVFVGTGSADPFSGKALRAAMGSTYHRAHGARDRQRGQRRVRRGCRALPPLPAADAGPCRIAQRRRGRRHPHL